jgi:UV excision repair protein RAD23
MKLTIKSLKQISYNVEIPQDATVLALKQEIENKHHFDSKSIKLLYNGIILIDDKNLSDLGIKDGQVIMMMSSKAIIKNVIKEEKKEEEALPTNNLNNLNTNSTLVDKSKNIKKPTISLPIPEKKDYTKEIQQLSEMGFPADMTKLAIEAAKGNVTQAVEFLYNGIPSNNAHSHTQNVPLYSEFLEEGEDEEDEEAYGLDPEVLNNLDLNNPETLKTIASIVKVIIQEDPSQLSNLLTEIEETNEEIIDYIKENEMQFKSLIEKPITPEDLLLFDSLMGGQGQAHYHAEGEEGDEFMEEGIPDILNMNAFIGNSGQDGQGIGLTLSNEDKEAVKRLETLGFNEGDALQAYMACDKNETLAANLLFDNKFKENDMDIDCKT